MDNRNTEIIKTKIWYYKDGKLFFNKEKERSVYFILTLVMLFSGILFKLGIL